MKTDNWEIIISNMPHRESLIAEVWLNNEQWAEIFKEDNSPWIEMFPKDDGGFWKINFDDFLEIIHEAKQFLDSLRDIPE